VNDPAEKANLFETRKDVAQRLLGYLGYFSYTKLAPTRLANVQEVYEWAHTAV